VNDREVAVAALGEAVSGIAGEDREQRIFLRADRAVPYDNLMQAMNSLRGAGFLRVSLVGAEGGAEA
jgi:biopolymer transport protein ExbD